MGSKANDAVATPVGASCSSSSVLGRGPRFRLSAGAVCLGLIVLLFVPTLFELAIYAAHSDLNSHVVLVPLITIWLLCVQRHRRRTDYAPGLIGALVLGGAGAGAFVVAATGRGTLSSNDDLALRSLAFVCALAAAGFLFMGSKWMRSAAFPIAFLVFMVPLPDAAVDWLEKNSMLASADAAAIFLSLTGTPVVRSGTVFELPRITLRVAQECSGIRSSWVLFITSLLASHLFLTSRWRKLFLVAFVIPLGILRNGFRILVIGLLCVHVAPDMIDSPIHHRGGPIFFALSLIPFTLVVWWLRRHDGRPNLSR